MKKIVFLGDSSHTNSALKAYQISYDIIIEEIYSLINESAISMFDRRLDFDVEDKNTIITILDNYRDEYIIRSIKKKKDIVNYYYEKSNTVDNRCYRCFLSASLSLDDENALSLELYQQLTKKLAQETDKTLTRCNL